MHARHPERSAAKSKGLLCHPERSAAESQDPAKLPVLSAAGSLDSTRDDGAFRRSLARWFARNQRDLPWRRTRDPYAILVSEIMLQQTTVAAVIPYYNRWLRRFPTFGALARAAESDVLHAWQGLGYYSRARNLHRLAQTTTTLPANVAALRSLPGIGRYTANAVAVFAFHQTLPIVEANTARVLARLFNIRESINSAAGREKLWNASARLVPKKGAREFQSAMMDLGALVCIARQPRCGICPIKRFCAAPHPHLLPVKRRRSETVKLVESHELIQSDGRLLLEQCRTRWRGMWMLPRARSETGHPIYTAHFPFTHHRIELQVFQSFPRPCREAERWFTRCELDEIPIPSPHRRALETSS